MSNLHQRNKLSCIPIPTYITSVWILKRKRFHNKKSKEKTETKTRSSRYPCSYLLDFGVDLQSTHAGGGELAPVLVRHLLQHLGVLIQRVRLVVGVLGGKLAPQEELCLIRVEVDLSNITRRQ